MVRAGKRSNVWSAAAFHWQTYFGHRHGRLPGKTLAADYAALSEIIDAQACGRESRALTLLEQIIDAPIPGVRLSVRYAAFWAWIEQGRPKRYTPPSRRIAADIRACIAQRAERAA